MAPPRVTETATAARQGAKGRPVLMILAASLAAIVILYFIIFAFMSETSPDSAVTGGPAAGISTQQADPAPAATPGGVVTPSQDTGSTPPSTTTQGTSN